MALQAWVAAKRTRDFDEADRIREAMLAAGMRRMSKKIGLGLGLGLGLGPARAPGYLATELCYLIITPGVDPSKIIPIC